MTNRVKRALLLVKTKISLFVLIKVLALRALTLFYVYQKCTYMILIRLGKRSKMIQPYMYAGFWFVLSASDQKMFKLRFSDTLLLCSKLCQKVNYCQQGDAMSNVGGFQLSLFSYFRNRIILLCWYDM